MLLSIESKRGERKRRPSDCPSISLYAVDGLSRPIRLAPNILYLRPVVSSMDMCSIGGERRTRYGPTREMMEIRPKRNFELRGNLWGMDSIEYEGGMNLGRAETLGWNV